MHLCFLIAILPCGLCFLYWHLVVSLLSSFLFWKLFLIYFGMFSERWERYWWDKYQSGNKQITSALSLEAKRGLFGCQANLKMLSTVAKVHEKCRKLFPRVLTILNCSNPNVPEGVSIRGDAYVVLLHRRNVCQNVYIFLMVYICKVTPSFSWWLLCWRWSCTA